MQLTLDFTTKSNKVMAENKSKPKTKQTQKTNEIKVE